MADPLRTFPMGVGVPFRSRTSFIPGFPDHDPAPLMTKKRWLLAGVVAVCLAVATTLTGNASQPSDDCAVAADVVETWTSLSASLNVMVGDPGGVEVLKAAQAEAAAADDIRAKAGQISSPEIRTYAVGLADALDQIAESQRSTGSSTRVNGSDAGYMDGSAAATASAAGLRRGCPSIPEGT